MAIQDPAYFPFFVEGMEFEEFVPEFGDWYAQGQRCAIMVGIRTDESFKPLPHVDQRQEDTS